MTREEQQGESLHDLPRSQPPVVGEFCTATNVLEFRHQKPGLADLVREHSKNPPWLAALPRAPEIERPVL